MTNTVNSSIWQAMDETSPGSDANTSPLTGWTVGTVASGNYSWFRPSTERGTSSFGTTVIPQGGGASPDTTNGDGLRTTGTYTGNFASGNWTFDCTVIAVSSGGDQDGNIGLRLWRSANADGSSATEITSVRVEGGAVTDLTTSTPQTSQATFNPGAFSLTNEYLFLQLAWEITGAGGMTTRDVLFRIGNTATKLISTDFTSTAATSPGWQITNGGWW